MKKVIEVFTVLFILCTSNLFAQQGWFWLNLTSYNSNFTNSFFLDNNVGFIGNQEGILFK